MTRDQDKELRKVIFIYTFYIYALLDDPPSSAPTEIQWAETCIRSTEPELAQKLKHCM